jgi:hypothetical protein
MIYLKLLHFLCRRELKKMSKIDSYPYTKEELTRWHDFMAIGCINAETETKDHLLGIMVSTANFLEYGE